MSLVGIDASSPVLRSPRLELVPRRQQFATWYASAERELMEDERLEDELLLEDRRLEDELLLQGELRPGAAGMSMLLTTTRNRQARWSARA